MFTCPHCQQPGVSIRGKLFAAPWSPARCKKCGLFSSERMGATRVVNGIAGGGPFLALFAAARFESTWPLIFFAAFLAIAYPSILVLSPLYPLTSDGVGAAKSGRAREFWILLLVLAPIAAFGLMAN